ncbi:MAG: efflux RND transporter periplasmic adaptor subunit [Desulfobacterales bacterium]|nr:MAG: efflux RND transporter periplasmic adaptor subunit [Desulfobacterales bacterium]
MSKTKRRIIHIVVTMIIVGLGALGFLVLTASKPQLKRTKPPAPKPTVRVMKVKTGPQAVIIKGEGTVRPLREIQLVPQVSGKIIYISPSLVDGGAFKKGDILLRINPVDYQLAVTLAQARVIDSVSKLKIAEEEAAAAQEEWRLFYQDKETKDIDPPPLVAKEPQLAAARAKLAADRADLQKAKLNLARTEIKTPFNGRVGAENVDIGQYVSPTQNLATLFSTEAAQIIVPFEDESLYWFHVPGFTPGDGPGAAVKVRTRFAGRESEWKGRVVRAQGKLDERTRMVDVVILVEKPYATRPPLAAGLFVTVEIQGRTIESAAVIPRSALRENDTVWVVDESGKLSFRKIEVARLTTASAILKGGLYSGEMVVTSALKAVTDGMRVRIAKINEVNDS